MLENASLPEPSPQPRTHQEGGSPRTQRKSLVSRRSAAKAGMTVSLGALVVTGFMGGRKSKALHMISGMALIGFSYWHHTLYQPRDGGRKTDRL